MDPLKTFIVVPDPVKSGEPPEKLVGTVCASLLRIIVIASPPSVTPNIVIRSLATSRPSSYKSTVTMSGIASKEGLGVYSSILLAPGPVPAPSTLKS